MIESWGQYIISVKLLEKPKGKVGNSADLQENLVKKRVSHLCNNESICRSLNQFR